jgi:hypothetical protein
MIDDRINDRKKGSITGHCKLRYLSETGASRNQAVRSVRKHSPQALAQQCVWLEQQSWDIRRMSSATWGGSGWRVAAVHIDGKRAAQIGKGFRIVGLTHH